MPVRIVVNRTRKLSKDYNSEAYGLSLDTEYNGDVGADPQAFAEQVNQLFDLIETLLDAKVNGARGEKNTTMRTHTSTRSTGNVNSRPTNGGREPHRGNGNDHGNGNGGPRKLTYAQEKAIKNMARKLDQDPDRWSQEDHGVPVRELTVKQASQLIDALKHEIEAGEPQGADA